MITTPFENKLVRHAMLFIITITLLLFTIHWTYAVVIHVLAIHFIIIIIAIIIIHSTYAVVIHFFTYSSSGHHTGLP